jgi:DNA-directed RNA polymerase specialized sigma24 family protein
VHGNALYRYALSRLRDEHKAEEVVQETLLAALQARERFAGGATVRTWLIGILKHKISTSSAASRARSRSTIRKRSRKATISSSAAFRATATGR